MQKANVGLLAGVSTYLLTDVNFFGVAVWFSVPHFQQFLFDCHFGWCRTLTYTGNTPIFAKTLKDEERDIAQTVPTPSTHNEEIALIPKIKRELTAYKDAWAKLRSLLFNDFFAVY